MPKPKHDIKEFHWLALKEKVQSMYDENISASADIQKLHTDILAKTGESLSTSTLYRLLLSPANRNIPYQNTLDILSDYCGHHNWDSFCKLQDHRTSLDTNQEVLPDIMGLRLLQICLQNHDFQSVIDYTKLLPERWIVDYSLQVKISETFGVAMRHDAQVRNVMLKELAMIPQGRHFFYETFVDLDHLNGYYGNALDTYEKYTPQLGKRRSLNDVLFIECLRFWRAYKVNDIKTLKRIGYRLFDLQPEQEIYEDDEVHFFPVARWWAYRLVYWRYCGALNSIKLETTIQKIEEFATNNNPHAVRIYLSKLFEALTIVNSSQHIPYLFQKYQNNIQSKINEAEGIVEFYALANKSNPSNTTFELIRNKNTYSHYSLAI